MKTFRVYVFILLLFSLLQYINPLQAQQSQKASSAAGIEGEWLITVDYFNNPLEQPVIFINKGSTLSAQFVGDTTT